jgi:acetylserotonin N-methyltransferase
MIFDLPAANDTAIWDTWLSAWRMPSLAVADRLGLFETLNAEPAGADELAAMTRIPVEPLKALLPMLSALGFLVPRRGRYQLTPAARLYLLHDSPFYWGHAFPVARASTAIDTLFERFKPTSADAPRTSDSWESGQVTAEMALNIARIMHSHSLPAALGAAREGDFTGVRRLLDVGGGSGCFSVALAQRFPKMRCTIMELPAMCERAKAYIADGEVSDRVDTISVDMFREAWPKGYDAVFMSNIFHDWTPAINAQLSASAFAALPPGGRIYLHEILINDEGSGPLAAASFAMLMLVGTKGRQYSFAELAQTLEGAGFVDARATSTYGYYSLVSAVKPKR